MEARITRRKSLPKIGRRTVKNPAEYDCYKHLRDMGLDAEYETESLPYTVEHSYTPDFPIAGTNKFIEYKGNGRAFDNAVRQKMIAVKNQYPQYEFLIVFHTDGKIGPKRKNGTFLKQSDWATKNGFRFCIGRHNIPKEWFE